MGLLDPTKEDNNVRKKPRFRQDMIAFLIMFLGGLAAIIYVMVT